MGIDSIHGLSMVIDSYQSALNPGYLSQLLNRTLTEFGDSQNQSMQNWLKVVNLLDTSKGSFQNVRVCGLTS